MKYEIETMIVCIREDDKGKIRKILAGDIYDVIDYSECGELTDEEEAREEFAKLFATATTMDDGAIEVRIPVLVRGEEELEEDVPDGEEPFYYLVEYEEIERRNFDEESLELFGEIEL